MHGKKLYAQKKQVENMTLGLLLNFVKTDLNDTAF